MGTPFCLQKNGRRAFYAPAIGAREDFYTGAGAPTNVIGDAGRQQGYGKRPSSRVAVAAIIAGGNKNRST